MVFPARYATRERNPLSNQKRRKELARSLPRREDVHVLGIKPSKLLFFFSFGECFVQS